MTDDRWKMERWKLGNPEMDKEIFLDDSTLYSDEKGNLPSSLNNR